MNRIRKLAARLLHDSIAHQLIGLSGGARWAERFHDWIGVRWAADEPSSAIVVRGSGPELERAVALLRRSGRYQLLDMMHDVATLEARDKEQDNGE